MNSTAQIRKLIIELLDKMGITTNDMLKALGLNASLISNMNAVRKQNINGEDKIKKGAMPSADKLGRIAQFLNVSTDYLLGISDYKYSVDYYIEQTKTSHLTSDEEKLVNAYRAFNQEGQEKLFDYIDDLKDTNKYIKKGEPYMAEKNK